MAEKKEIKSSMKLKDLVKILDKVFNRYYAIEDDPVGLQIGKSSSEINKILITLDITQEVVDEAVLQKADIIIAHHPLIFYPLKDITENSLPGSKIYKLVENNIAVYIAHTNLDSMPSGINELIARKLELKDIEIIEEARVQWFKFAVFSPPESENKIREAMFKNGGGQWADYSCCSFNSGGKGTFMPGAGANPYSGRRGEINFVDEVKIECVVNEENLKSLTQAVISAHPYEEPAYDIYRLENSLASGGLARAGRLYPKLTLQDFMIKLKNSLDVEFFRWAASDSSVQNKKLIEKVAVVNGSANSFTDRYFFQNTDIDLIIVGELKYSKMLDIIQGGKILIELGHGESEKLAIDIIYNKLSGCLNGIKGLELIKSKYGFAGWRYFFG